MTQAELAARVSEAGLPFHQQTIQRIESGTRPIRLNEAGVIALALGARLVDMSRPETTATASKDLVTAAQRLVLAAENFGSPPASYSQELQERMDDAEAARQHYQAVCESLGTVPDKHLVDEFMRDYVKGVATQALLQQQAAAWATISSIEVGTTYEQTHSLGVDIEKIKEFAQRLGSSFEDGADVPAESARGESDA